MIKVQSKNRILNEEQTAVRVSLVSIAGNVILTLFKLAAGLFAHSGAMVSDAIHSASDVISSIIVIVGVKISGKQADEQHPYGHERFESVAALILSVMLAGVGVLIGFRALQSIISGSYKEMVIPGLLALIASAVSIVGKTAMFFYTEKKAKEVSSTALKADAWHHLSDALSSVGAMIGIGGAMLGVTVMEPLASVVICLMILKAAVDIFRDALDQMLDRSAGSEIEEQIRTCVLAQKDILGVDLLHTRMFGNKIYVDLEISLNGSISLKAAHEVAQTVHDALEEAFPQIKHVMIHINPAEEEAG